MAESILRNDINMKNNCPECKSPDIVEFDRTAFKNPTLREWICRNCGLLIEYIHQECGGITKLNNGVYICIRCSSKFECFDQGYGKLCWN